MAVSAVRLFTQQLASPGMRVDVPGVSGLSPQLAQLGPPYSLVRMGRKACSESRRGKQGHSLALLLDEVSAIGTCRCAHLFEPKRPQYTVGKGRRCCPLVGGVRLFVPHRRQHARLLCSPLSPGVRSNSLPLSQ